jgi:hypothetical protein
MLSLESALSKLEVYALMSKQAQIFCKFFSGQSRNPKMFNAGQSSRFSTMEEKLIKKVEALFESPCMLDEDYIWEDEPAVPLKEIPFHPWFPHDDESVCEYLDQLPEAERLAILLTWNITDDPRELPQQITEAFSLKTSPTCIPEIQDLRPVFKMFAAQQKPIHFFADALRIVNRLTGNYWLDGICECGGSCGCGIPWDLRSIKTVSSQLKKAKHIINNVNVLSKWIRQKPNQNVLQIIGLFSGQSR